MTVSRNRPTSIQRNTTNADGFNSRTVLPYSLRIVDFQIAMQDVYDLFMRGFPLALPG